MIDVDVEYNTLKLYVGRLPYQTTDQELADLFGRYGEILSANVAMDRETGRSRGFGFVEMSNDQEAQAAMNELNNSTLQGRTIIVNEAQERREPRRDGGGGGGGGFQGGRNRRPGGGGDDYQDRGRRY